MQKTSPEEQLSAYVRALHPIIYINNFDFKVVEDLIIQVSKQLGLESQDLRSYDFAETPEKKTREKGLSEFLRDQLLTLEHRENNGERRYASRPLFITLRDVHVDLNNPEIIALLKKMAMHNLYTDLFCTIFIISSKLEIPLELEKLITIFEVPFPDHLSIKEIIKDFQKSYGLKTFSDENLLDNLARYFKGLSHLEIKKTLNLCYQERGFIGSESKELILEEKKQIIKKSGLLELKEVKNSFQDVGGLNVLRSWLLKKAEIINSLEEARKFNVDLPKGIMVVGQPGCGKSLVAKATADLFKVPLLRLDIGKLLGKYVGESENNFHQAIQISEAVSPCVLWIDEIEKAFSGIGSNGSGSEVSTRLFGSFLTWLQEKESLVFVIVTANEIADKLPPEFFRKGRFDQVFYIGLPDLEDQKKIFKIHLKNRGKKWSGEIKDFFASEANDGYQALVKNRYYSGADIEAIVKQSIENVFFGNRGEIRVSDLRHAILNSPFINEQEKQKIEVNRKKLDQFGVLNASGTNI